MSSTTTKVDLLARIEAEREYWRSLVARAGPDRLEEPGPMGAWTFKDLAAHLTGWRERAIGRLEAAGRGDEAPPTPWPPHLIEDDEVNDWIQSQSAGRTARDVLEAADDSFQRLASAVAALSEEDVETPGRFPWLDGQSLAGADLFGHLHEEHESDILAWLAAPRPKGGA